MVKSSDRSISHTSREVHRLLRQQRGEEVSNPSTGSNLSSS